MMNPVSESSKNLAQHITSHVIALIALGRQDALDVEHVKYMTDMLALQIELNAVSARLKATHNP